MFKKILSSITKDDTAEKNEVNIYNIQFEQKDNAGGLVPTRTPDMFYEICAYAGLLMSMVVILVLSGVLIYSPSSSSNPQLSGCTADEFGPRSRSGSFRVAESNLSVTIGSWGKYQISRTATASIVFQNFRVLIYQRLLGTTRDEYYFAPALLINDSSVRTVANVFDKRYETRFSVIMYSAEMVAHLRNELEAQLKVPVAELRVIPVEEIRILPASEMTANFEIDSLWKSYSTQPSTVEFRILCTSVLVCEEVAFNIRHFPKLFSGSLEVQYTMETQQTASRRLRVTVENIQNSKMFSDLNQRYKEQSYAYLGASDAKKIQMEVLNNVIASEVTDAEFLTSENMPSLTTLIDRALNFQRIPATQFEERMWNSTFWSEENARPDRIARDLQDKFDSSTSEQQDSMRKDIASASSDETEAHASGGAAGFSANMAYKESHAKEQASSVQAAQAAYRAEQNKQKVIVVGDKIIPKSLELARANLAELRQTTKVESTQIRVAKVHGVLKANLNVFGAAKDLREVFYVRTQNPISGFTKPEAMSICRDYYSAALATLEQLKLAWSQGANWCLLGHLADTGPSYPSHTCSQRIPSTAAEAEACASPSHFIKAGVVSIGSGSNSTQAKAGSSCFGIKPHPSRKHIADGEILLTAWFNNTNYSQYQ